jgi:TolA-binding protein
MVALIPRIALISLVGLLTSGCFLWTSRKDGDAMRAELQGLEERTVKLESELEADRARLTDMIERARGDMVELEETLTRATRVLARNSADFGAEVESVKDKLREVDGTLAEMGYEVEQMGKRVEGSERKVNDFALAAGLDLPVDDEKVPDGAQKHLAAIKDSLAAGRYGEARSLAKIFHDRYPKDEGADEVQLLIARSYLEQKRWAKALGALRRFTDRYPKSELTPEALYEMANAFYQLGDCTDARILVEAITSRHQKSPFADKARALMDTMNGKGARCTS